MSSASAARAIRSVLLPPSATPTEPAVNITAATSSAGMPTKIEERGDFECFVRCGTRGVEMTAHLRVTDSALAEPHGTSVVAVSSKKDGGGDLGDVLGGWYLAAAP